MEGEMVGDEVITGRGAPFWSAMGLCGLEVQLLLLVLSTALCVEIGEVHG